MKKNIFLFFLSISLLTFVGCEQSLDAEIANTNYITFAENEVDLEVNKGSSASVTYDVYTSQTSGSERTYTIVVDEDLTDADTAAYQVPSTVTIPANSNKGYVSVSVEDINIVASKTLALRFKEENSVVAGEMLKVNILRICDFDITNFYGTYGALEDGQYAYDVEVTAGPVANTLTLTNLYEAGGSTVIGLDISNKSIAFRSIEFGAVLYVHPTYGDLFANTLAATTASSFGLCDLSMDLNFIRTVAAGNFTTEINVALTKK